MVCCDVASGIIIIETCTVLRLELAYESTPSIVDYTFLSAAINLQILFSARSFHHCLLSFLLVKTPQSLVCPLFR